jgi:parvulin-like peptidyl-prolyl cis-trans isomerase-like protein
MPVGNHRKHHPSPARAALLAALCLLPALGCAKTEHSSATVSGDSTAPPPAKEAPVTAGASETKSTMPPPAHIQVQHVLIGFSGSVPGKSIARTQEEARKLAYEILAKAKAGEDFGALVTQYTDDRPPGIYSMSASGVPPAPGEYGRDQMVPAFGNVGFAIAVGDVGIADYDPAQSPYGWHVIKRLR